MVLAVHAVISSVCGNRFYRSILGAAWNARLDALTFVSLQSAKINSRRSCSANRGVSSTYVTSTFAVPVLVQR